MDGYKIEVIREGQKMNFHLGDLYQWFTDTYAHLSLKEL